MMVKIFFLLYFIVVAILCYCKALADDGIATTAGTGSTNKRQLKVLTMNTWMGGSMVEDGTNKMVRHIRNIDADIVALQEVTNHTWFFDSVVAALGPPWKGILGCQGGRCYNATVMEEYAGVVKLMEQIGDRVGNLSTMLHNSWAENLQEALGGVWTVLGKRREGFSGAAIMTKHEFVETRRFDILNGLGVAIRLSSVGDTPAGSEQQKSQMVNFVALHLNSRSYGPYAANNKLVTSASQLLQGERAKEAIGRQQNVEELLNHTIFKSMLDESGSAVGSGTPLIIAGDFNSPSHLDWVEETRKLHGGWVFEWPATKLLADAGFVDSFRQLHPNVTETPGLTWSTVRKSSGSEWDYSIAEPQDRIDYILYKGAGAMPTASELYPPVGISEGSNSSNSSAGLLLAIPNHKNNDYPSDHYALHTTFDLLPITTSPPQ